MTELSLMSVAIENSKYKAVNNVLSVIGGVVLISVLAQLVIRLPWTPVPITGQTLGVTLVALSWGRKRALATVASYLAVGGLGLPVFAMGASGLSVGPTIGYLVGMLCSSWVVGSLADRGWTKSLWKALAAAFIGSTIVFSMGLLVLSHFISGPALLAAGLLPFLPGDLIKNSLAAFLSWKARDKYKLLSIVLILLVPMSSMAATVNSELKVTERGFSPSEIKVKEGDDVNLLITRITDSTCSKAIQVPSKKIKKNLPLNKQVKVSLGRVKKGTIKFGCTMNMMDSGSVIVE